MTRESQLSTSFIPFATTYPAWAEQWDIYHFSGSSCSVTVQDFVHIFDWCFDHPWCCVCLRPEQKAVPSILWHSLHGSSRVSMIGDMKYCTLSRNIRQYRVLHDESDKNRLWTMACSGPIRYFAVGALLTSEQPDSPKTLLKRCISQNMGRLN